MLPRPGAPMSGRRSNSRHAQPARRAQRAQWLSAIAVGLGSRLAPPRSRRPRGIQRRGRRFERTGRPAADGGSFSVAATTVHPPSKWKPRSRPARGAFPDRRLVNRFSADRYTALATASKTSSRCSRPRCAGSHRRLSLRGADRRRGLESSRESVCRSKSSRIVETVANARRDTRRGGDGDVGARDARIDRGARGAYSTRLRRSDRKAKCGEKGGRKE